MNTKDLIRLGVPPGEPNRRGIDFISRYILKGLDKTKLEAEVEAVVKNPGQFVDDDLRGEFAKCLLRCPREIREATARWKQWGEGLEPEAINQMGPSLPVADRGGGRFDAGRACRLWPADRRRSGHRPRRHSLCRGRRHRLPHETDRAWICPCANWNRMRERLTRAIEAETRFGVGATFQRRREHPVAGGGLVESPR
jgi:tRNA-splicing ligase RtcB